MKIYVCIKQVPDTSINIKVVGENDIEKTGCKFVINPYDEYAIEEAISIAQGSKNGEIVIITIGSANAVNTMRNALAMGADRGILIKNDNYFLDSVTTALALKQSILNDGKPDLILMGRNSIDSEGMQTQYRLAQLLGLPVANEITKLEKGNGIMRLEKEIEGGSKQIIEIKTPCVIGATKGLNNPRYPKLPDILKAKKKTITEFNLSDLGITSHPEVELIKLESAKERTSAQIIEGTTAEAVQTLVKILKDKEKVI